MKNYNIVYEDDDILLIDKPQGIATASGKNINLCEYIFNDFSNIKNVNGYKINEGGLLNRLDNETGGIIFFAKTNGAFQYYSNEMKSNKIKKIYSAVVEGIPDKSEGIINYPIAHHNKNIKKMICITNNQKHRGNIQKSETYWKLKKTLNNKSLLEIFIYKGIRHQIRIHLACINLSIIGDKLYNKIKYPEIKNHLLYSIGVNFFTSTNKEINILLNDPFEFMF